MATGRFEGSSVGWALLLAAIASALAAAAASAQQSTFQSTFQKTIDPPKAPAKEIVASKEVVAKVPAKEAVAKATPKPAAEVKAPAKEIVETDHTRTRFIIGLERRVEFKVSALTNPDRVSVDLPQVRLDLPPPPGDTP